MRWVIKLQYNTINYTCFTNVATPSPAASTCLTLREIENELSEVTGEDWYPLGVQLGLRAATLREIQKNYPRDTERCRSEVLHLWLCTTPKVSWKTLAQAVQGLGRYTSLAQKLRRKTPPAPKGYCNIIYLLRAIVVKYCVP